MGRKGERVAEYVDIDAPISFAVYQRNRRIEATLRQILENNDATIPSVWISVEERLPQDGQKVLCLQDRKYYGIGMTYRILTYAENLEDVDDADFARERRSGWYYYDSEYGNCEATDIVYWMPLPQPPRKAEATTTDSMMRKG